MSSIQREHAHATPPVWHQCRPVQTPTFSNTIWPFATIPVSSGLAAISHCPNLWPVCSPLFPMIYQSSLPFLLFLPIVNNSFIIIIALSFSLLFQLKTLIFIDFHILSGPPRKVVKSGEKLLRLWLGVVNHFSVTRTNHCVSHFSVGPTIV